MSLGSGWAAVGCCLVELYGQANAFHYANSNDGGCAGIGISSQFRSPDGCILVGIRTDESFIGDCR